MIRRSTGSAALAAAFVLGLAAIAVAQPPIREPIRTVFIDHPDDPRKKVEIIWIKPPGEGPFPVLVLVHGHQEGARPGAAMYLEGDALRRFAAPGYLVAAVSQPGYGKSSGPPDFCGPRSQAAIVAAVSFARGLKHADSKRVALYGYSRGAIASAMAATRLPDLTALILGAGIYDLKAEFARQLPGVKANIKAEAGTSDEAFRARSAMQHVVQIKAPTLILHGELDDRGTAALARQFGESLEKAGTPARVVIFPGTGHSIPRPQLNEEVSAFLRRQLLEAK